MARLAFPDHSGLIFFVLALSATFSASLPNWHWLSVLPCNEVLLLLVVSPACAKLVVCLLANGVMLSTYVFLCTDLLTEQELQKNLEELLEKAYCKAKGNCLGEKKDTQFLVQLCLQWETRTHFCQTGFWFFFCSRAYQKSRIFIASGGELFLKSLNVGGFATSICQLYRQPDLKCELKPHQKE